MPSSRLEQGPATKLYPASLKAGPLKFFHLKLTGAYWDPRGAHGQGAGASPGRQCQPCKSKLPLRLLCCFLTCPSPATLLQLHPTFPSRHAQSLPSSRRAPQSLFSAHSTHRHVLLLANSCTQSRNGKDTRVFFSGTLGAHTPQAWHSLCHSRCLLSRWG